MPDDGNPKRSGFNGSDIVGSDMVLDEFVAIDLETTGLDPVNDRITEIGATRFDRSGAATTFTSLVNPGRRIPPEIEALTGIANEDVASAPTVTAVGAKLAAFAGGLPVVGQNVAFDLAFLRNAGVHLAGTPFDTHELASVLLPTASRLDLGSLAELLGVHPETRHRALADAEATRDVFLRLLQLLERQPRATLIDLHAIAGRADWPFQQLLAITLDRGGGDAPEAPRPMLAMPSREPMAPALTPAETPRTVTETDVDRLFEAAASGPQSLPRFEPRPGQVQMAHAVSRNIAVHGHLAVEAGTGTGKSLAYLLPALLHAKRNDDRVVVSTHTLNLQEQLARSDVPAAAALVEAHEGEGAGSVRAALLKGRANYLCNERWAEARESRRPTTRPEARLHARITVWLPYSDSGDLAELYMPSEQRPAWSALAADSNDCLSRRCSYVRDGSCFLLRARQRAAAAHVVIVNHALLLANAATDNQALPPFRQLVIDEAHRLEDVATDQYGAALSLRELGAQLDGLRSTEGAAGTLRAAASADDSVLSRAAGLTATADSIATAAQRAGERLSQLTSVFRAYADERGEGAAARPGGIELSLTSARHSQPLWDEVDEAAVQLDVTLLHLGDQLTHARAAAGALPEGAAPGLDRLQSNLARDIEAIATARRTLGDVALRSDPELIAWLRVSERDVLLHVAPLEVAGRLAENIYEECDSVTATSATLAAGGSFDFLVGRLGLQEPETLHVPSPFDFRRAVLAIAVDDLPDPNAPGYAPAAHRALAAAVEAAGGRTLALFTSHHAVRMAADALRRPLNAQGIDVLAQQVDGSPARLLRTLAERPRTLILGTAALWEGVDVRGPALSQIVVARLPFPVPTDPIYAGRAAQYEDPFSEYAVPRAVLRFRQGFGRLIRGSDECGVFLILDSRAVTRRYGEAFLESLPDCELRRLPASAVGEAVSGWLGR